ncbi:peptidoglycan DD-metalloendopeptidase family protein [Pseudoduganella sp. FT93W]|uniref:Peptidoglycan DD-metalloendopeptidase family protein n=1 Tax=Duganella fentianensis TaxID=2692177 RepID=A0A845HY54_9BURK|nr:peptidoglycan DD-metalloendopeptidase family protein [Duganella fentianensis]MYN44485.1 peptidoglycan DD-metalloendopeptidase family protein [Duganella fentianensis]
MTKKNSALALILGSSVLLAACTSVPNQAPVIDRPVASSSKPVVVTEPAPVVRDERGMYTVKKGDTLIRIALEFGQNYRDLVSWNNLSNPNDIKVDQVLRVLPPEAAPAGSGVQTGAITMPPADKPVPVVRKSEPRGDKKAYSESALAELQRPDGAKADKPGSKAGAAAGAAAVAETVVTVPAPAPAPAPAVEEEKLSWMWPADGKVIATFDEGKNKGVDIAGKAGQPVVAAGAGKVMYAGSGIRGYGNLVIVKHSNSLLSAYAHNRSIVVKEGNTVTKGQQIAEMGDSDTDTVKLHFEIRQQGKPVDPSRFLPNR